MSEIRVFTDKEKRDLAHQVFVDISLDLADLRSADLRGARFRCVSLRAADLRGADLRGAEFVECDLREAYLSDVQLGLNTFEGCRLHGATGLSEPQRQYVVKKGGDFVSAGAPPGGQP